MFEKASRLKLRFNCKGICTVEDLWDLNANALDSIYKDLNTKKKSQEGESLLEKKTNKEEELDLQIEIVKYIFTTKMQERKERENLAEKIAKKKKILGIIAEKQDDALKNMSLDELSKLVGEL
jgi:hypothetical protein